MYKTISNFGACTNTDAANNSPLSYCLLQTLDNEFLHGGHGNVIGGAHGKNCQNFMSSYCANNWNNICEFKSHDQSIIYPNSLGSCGGGGHEHISTTNDQLTAGQILIRNTAAKKYLTHMGGCVPKYEPFDPTVAASPLIFSWEKDCHAHGSSGCVPVYEVNPYTIDCDPVMNKILAKPIIAMTILVNIYNTAMRKGTMADLEGTRLHHLFFSPQFQSYMRHRG